MPKISKKLNEIIKNYKSCFNCTNFKIKPFKLDSNKSINIFFETSKNKVRCTKNLIKDLMAKNEIYQTKSSYPGEGLIMQSAMKSSKRFKNISSQCLEYDGE